MARTRDPERLHQILECATHTFIGRSYRQARMSHVASDAGVAPGTLYLYFESKAALFQTVLLRAFLGDRFEAPAELPIPDPGPEAILELVRERYAEEWWLESLETLSPSPSPSDEAVLDELRRVIAELYAKVDRFRFAIRIIERSAPDWPELFDLHFKTMRRSVLKELTRYLDLRIGQGRLRELPDTPTAARVLLETVAWFAMHRHFAPDSKTITDQAARETVTDLLLHALATPLNLPSPSKEHSP